MRRLIFSLCLFFAMPMVAWAGYDEAVAAYQAKDYAKAFREVALLAEQGDAVAQFNLGVMYSEGQGVAQDKQAALKWYRLAAQQGIARAQFILALAYESGDGVAQDNQEAAKWYRLVAQHGEALAQFRVGQMYLNGEGVVQDEKEAVQWFRLAAAQRYAKAQLALAQCYKNAYGVAQNLTLAYALYLQVDPDGAAQRMLSSLTPDQLQAGQTLAGELQGTKDFLGTLDAYRKKSDDKDNQ